MAWQGRVEQIAKGSPQTVTVTVSFYDDAVDATGASPQFTQDLSFPVNATAAQMQTAIRALGADCRNCVARVATLQAAAPVGTLISIP